jgi:hypothetical protein
MIEVLVIEWLAKHGASDKEADKEKAKLIRELMSEVKSEFDTPDIQRAERDQYRKRLEHTQALRRNMTFSGQEWKPFEYLTEEGLKATDPFDYDKARETANKAEKVAEESKKAAEKEASEGAKKAAEKEASEKAAEKAEREAKEAKNEADKQELRARMVKKAADNDELRPDELFAIRLYTAGDYKYINPVLVNDPEFLERNLKTVGAQGAKSVETTWAFEDVEKKLTDKASQRALKMEAMQHSRRALAGLAKLPNAPSTDTYRGLALTQAELNGYKKGNKAPPWAAFSSTSTNSSMAEQYAKTRAFEQKGKLPVLIISTVTQGKNINPVSFYPNETEILVLPGAEFTVTQGPTKKNGVYEVHQLQTPAPGSMDEMEEYSIMKEYYEQVLNFEPALEESTPRTGGLSRGEEKVNAELPALERELERRGVHLPTPEAKPPAKSVRPPGQIAQEESRPRTRLLEGEYANPRFRGWPTETLEEYERYLTMLMWKAVRAEKWEELAGIKDEIDEVRQGESRVHLSAARATG